MSTRIKAADMRRQADAAGYLAARNRIAATLGLCLAWVGVALILAALTGCANFRAAGTFQYEGDNMRAALECNAKPEPAK